MGSGALERDDRADVQRVLDLNRVEVGEDGIVGKGARRPGHVGVPRHRGPARQVDASVVVDGDGV
jgi:hypothetical protein